MIIDRKNNLIVNLGAKAEAKLRKKRSNKRRIFFGRIIGQLLIQGFVHEQYNINVESWVEFKAAVSRNRKTSRKGGSKNYSSEFWRHPAPYQGKVEGS